jgi:hypothetical protein
MPGRGKPPALQSVSELWSGVIGFSIFGGLFLGEILVGTRADSSAPFWPTVLVGGFVAVSASVLNVVYVRELVRRGARVPPGTVRHPVLMTLAQTVLLLALGVAVDVAFVGIALLLERQRVNSPALVGVVFGAVIFASFGLIRFIILIGRRWARTSPGPEGSGTPAPRPPADPPE